MSDRPAAVVRKDFPELGTRRFSFRFRGKSCDGFVVRKADRYYAYQNECRHVPVSLDLDSGEFFTHDRKLLQCQSHGAVYEVESGVCTAGPCRGARLHALRVVEEPERLLIYLPEDFHGSPASR